MTHMHQRREGCGGFETLERLGGAFAANLGRSLLARAQHECRIHLRHDRLARDHALADVLADARCT